MLPTSLTDVNECLATPSPCDQGCTNTVGSYQCSCNDGYVLHENGRSCNGMSYLWVQ